MHIDRTIPEIVRFARMHSIEQLLATRKFVFVSSQNHQDVKLRIRELDRLTLQLQQPTVKVNDQISYFEDPPRTERSLQRVSPRFLKKCLSGNVLRLSCLVRWGGLANKTSTKGSGRRLTEECWLAVFLRFEKRSTLWVNS
jgi:hypothetical protein